MIIFQWWKTSRQYGNSTRVKFWAESHCRKNSVRQGYFWYFRFWYWKMQRKSLQVCFIIPSVFASTGEVDFGKTLVITRQKERFLVVSPKTYCVILCCASDIANIFHVRHGFTELPLAHLSPGVWTHFCEVLSSESHSSWCEKDTEEHDILSRLTDIQPINIIVVSRFPFEYWMSLITQYYHIGWCISF